MIESSKIAGGGNAQGVAKAVITDAPQPTRQSRKIKGTLNGTFKSSVPIFGDQRFNCTAPDHGFTMAPGGTITER